MVQIYGVAIEEELIKSSLPDEIDLFISSIGWEERCPIGWDLLVENKISVKRKVIFFYEEVINQKNSFEDLNARERNITDFKQKFDFTDKDSALFVAMLDEDTGLKKFQQFIEEVYGGDIGQISIVFDFTVMVKPYFFILLKLLSLHKKIKKVFLLYTEPKTYVVKKLNFEQLDEAYFTRGSYTPPTDMLSFSGDQSCLKSEALILLLGFEGQRAKEIFNEINPDVTIPINGFPSYRPEFKDVSLLLNDEILKESHIRQNLRYAPSNNPFETKQELTLIYEERKKRDKITLAPLGPKPMALGCCLFVLEHPECRVVYPYPKEYNSKSSRGYEKCWLYLTEFYYD